MKCEEPLYTDGEDISYRDCQLKLGHPGAHEYFGEKFPRPVPADEMDPRVTALIEEAARKRGAWGLDERKWPIVVEVTNVYIINAPGESEDEALKYWGNGDYPDLDGEQAIDGSFDVRRADRYELSANQPCSPFGPLIACPDCGRQEMQREWLHNPLRRCHGPIEWRETQSQKPQYRWRREYSRGPVYDAARQAVAA